MSAIRSLPANEKFPRQERYLISLKYTRFRVERPVIFCWGFTQEFRYEFG